MLNLDAFELAQLQNFLHLLNLYEGAGVDDLRFVRQGLSEHVRAQALAKRVSERESKPNPSPLERFGICPSCGAKQVVRIVVSGELVEICKRCRWSHHAEVVR